MSETELRELDAWIAEHVMGLAKAFGLKKRGYWYRPEAKGYTDRQSEAWRLPLEEAKKHEYKRGDEPVLIFELDTPRYTKDHASAMMVLEKCAGKVNVTIAEVGLVWDVMARDWDRVNTGDQIQPELVSAQGDTFLLAICLFAKKLYSNDQCEAQTKTGE